MSAAGSKRHSYGGPRPLHLVDTNNFTPLSASPLQSFRTAEPSPPPPGTKNTHKRHPQRQSSISYFSRDSERSSSPFAPRHALSRSMSLGPSSPQNGAMNGDSRGNGSTPTDSEVLERPPLTLAEKSVFSVDCTRKRVTDIELQSGMPIFYNS